MKKFILTKKKQLTHDVYELEFECDGDLDHTPGQFITFILPDGIGGKSYSLLSTDQNKCILIIKRCEDGKGGSKYICDAELGHEFSGVGPVGKFVLSPEKNAKLFAGTGTGIVPLYNQIVSALESGNSSLVGLLFGVRTKGDLFYLEEFEKLEKKYTNFECKIALSREDTEEHYHGYITDFVNENYTSQFQEAYLCGAPVVVDSMKEVLENVHFPSEYIFSEKY